MWHIFTENETHVSFYGGGKVDLTKYEECLKDLAELEHDISFMRSCLDSYRNMDSYSISGHAYHKRIHLSALDATLKCATVRIEKLEKELFQLKKNK